MRWPFGPPHLTLKPSKKNRTKTKKTKKEKKARKKKPKRKTAKIPKIAFQLSVKFSFFGWLFKSSLF